MTVLPITHMTLYKHGVGFFERRMRCTGEEVQLSFRVEEMNDILKSLTALDLGGGQVLGIDYATPQNPQERLAGCSIRLEHSRSLRDLLVSLRGRRVTLRLDQEEQATGRLLGLDELPDPPTLTTALVSLLRDDGVQVQTVPLGRVWGVDILDEQGAADLRFFLDTALGQEAYRQVTIRLTPGEHDLVVSYIAPAPTWRVSYRLVLETSAPAGPRALLLGWGIFDNRLEEDLQGIALSLVAGMPISFIYNLYTPFMPERPEVEEEQRVAAQPVTFAEALPSPAPGAVYESYLPSEEALRRPAFAARAMAAPLDELAAAAPVKTQGKALGELFQYVIGTPVTVRRGHSAMVPIASARLGYRKELLYNGSQLAAHPVATLRLKNETGLTLERGPVTVLENGEYVGEAILPFTVVGGEIVVPYAVELGIQIDEESSSRRELHRLHLKGAYLHFEEWEIRQREYRLTNRTGEPVRVLIEHPRQSQYELFEIPTPVEQTEQHFRFELEAPAGQEATLPVKERRLVTRQTQLERQSYADLKAYLQKGLLNKSVYEQAVAILKLRDKIADNNAVLERLEQERQKIYQAQQQIQGNMSALGQSGKEGTLRARYVEQLEATEGQLKALAARESSLKAENEQLQREIESRLQALSA